MVHPILLLKLERLNRFCYNCASVRWENMGLRGTAKINGLKLVEEELVERENVLAKYAKDKLSKD
jgi:hypothetical protein